MRGSDALAEADTGNAGPYPAAAYDQGSPHILEGKTPESTDGRARLSQRGARCYRGFRVIVCVKRSLTQYALRASVYR